MVCYFAMLAGKTNLVNRALAQLTDLRAIVPGWLTFHCITNVMVGFNVMTRQMNITQSVVKVDFSVRQWAAKRYKK